MSLWMPECAVGPSPEEGAAITLTEPFLTPPAPGCFACPLPDRLIPIITTVLHEAQPVHALTPLPRRPHLDL